MAVPLYFKDGDMPVGTSDITIGGQAYMVISFTPDRPVAEVVDQNNIGSDYRARVTRKQSGFTAELQLPTGSTGYPNMGETFTYTVDDNYGSETWVVHNCIPNISNDAESVRTITITGKEVLDTITVVNPS